MQTGVVSWKGTSGRSWITAVTGVRAERKGNVYGSLVSLPEVRLYSRSIVYRILSVVVDCTYIKK